MPLQCANPGGRQGVPLALPSPSRRPQRSKHRTPWWRTRYAILAKAGRNCIARLKRPKSQWRVAYGYYIVSSRSRLNNELGTQ
eukprot:6212017-Pleurochrysis_carterae.AAC.4